MYQITQWIKETNYDPTPTQTELIRGIAKYNPTHFLTVQLPLNWRNGNIHKYNQKLKKILKRFQKCLRRNHWNKNPLPMICIAERNTCAGYHFHILIYNCQYTTEQLQNALDRTTYDFKLTHHTFELEPITFTPEHLYFYCVKQIKTEHDIKDRISTTSTLFNIPEKRQTKQHIQPTKPLFKTIHQIKKFIFRSLFIGCLWCRLTVFPLQHIDYQPDFWVAGRLYNRHLC